MRTNHEFRRDATHIEETADKKAADLTGIAGLAILAKLPSIDFPRSFPPDSMHLFFENVIPALVRHYRGVFFKKDHTPHRARTASDNDQVEAARPAPRGLRRQRRSTVNSGSTAASQAAREAGARGGRGEASGASRVVEARKLKFQTTSDAWNVGHKVWERIGLDQEVISHRASHISAPATACKYSY